MLRSLLAINGITRPEDEPLRQTLLHLVSHATTYPETPQRPDLVALYDRVTLASLDEPEQAFITFELVTPVESPEAGERISVLAPLGMGVLGRALGDAITITPPGGNRRYRIVAVHKSSCGA